MTTEIAFLALGSNVGDRQRHLARARRRLSAEPGVEIIALSVVEETEPIGPPDQGAFLNQMIAVRTDLQPEALLDACHRVEGAGGRVRRERWGPRTIDIDIVRFGARNVDLPRLTIPHPEFENRDFWRREMDQLQTAMAARE